MTEQSQFEGWAILEIFGHQKYAGYVKTEYYGTACMFRCDVPPLEEREQVTRAGCYVNCEPNPDSGQVEHSAWVPPGSSVKKAATLGYSKLFGVGAIYSMTPCDQEAALRAVEELQPRSLMLVSLPVGKTITAAATFGNPFGVDLCPGCQKQIDLCSCAEEDDLI